MNNIKKQTSIAFLKYFLWLFIIILFSSCFGQPYAHKNNQPKKEIEPLKTISIPSHKTNQKNYFQQENSQKLTEKNNNQYTNYFNNLSLQDILEHANDVSRGQSAVILLKEQPTSHSNMRTHRYMINVSINHTDTENSEPSISNSKDYFPPFENFKNSEESSEQNSNQEKNPPLQSFFPTPIYFLNIIQNYLLQWEYYFTEQFPPHEPSSTFSRFYKSNYLSYNSDLNNKKTSYNEKSRQRLENSQSLKIDNDKKNEEDLDPVFPPVMNLIVDTGTQSTLVLCCDESKESSVIDYPNCVQAKYCDSNNDDNEHHLRIDTRRVFYWEQDEYNQKNFEMDFSKNHASGQLLVAYSQEKYWNGTSGSLGLKYNWNSSKLSFQKILESNSAITSLQFALDLNPSDSSYIHIPPQLDSFVEGKFTASREEIEWSERQMEEYGKPDYHQFPIFNLTLCDVSLFSNYSSNWQAIIDTGSTELLLPLDFYLMVMSWLPVTCNTDNTTCYLSEEFKGSIFSLPDLKFQLSETGEPLAIKLGYLVDSDTRQLAIAPVSNQYLNLNPAETERPPQIMFGTRVLYSFFAVFDMKAFKVGLAQKTSRSWITESSESENYYDHNNILSSSKVTNHHNQNNDAENWKRMETMKTTTAMSSCPAVAECRGKQRYYAPKNLCLPPECGQYFFHALDEETMTCHVNIAFQVIAFMFIGVIILIEASVFEVYNFLTRMLQRQQSHPHID